MAALLVPVWGWWPVEVSTFVAWFAAGVVAYQAIKRLVRRRDQ